MSLTNTLKYILNHPLNKTNKVNAFLRFVKWQLNTRLNPYPVIFPYAEKSKFIMWKGLTGATGNMYCGLHEFEDMAFVLHFLRPTDTFIDIGANVGSYTILGAGEVGSKTISVEPIPSTFSILESNISLNKIEKTVTALNIGLGAQKGELRFTRSLDTVNHVATDTEKDTINVPIEKFDDLIALETPTLIKMDVEGFETEVLNGMDRALSQTFLKALIIELNGAGKRYGYDEDAIHQKLLSHGFTPFVYSPFERKLIRMETYGNLNTIYIRDLEFVQERLRSARKFHIHNREI